MRFDVALLTERRYEAPKVGPGDAYKANILRDDQLLQDALKRLGKTSVRVDWSRADVDWRAFRLAVFRTTWDYFDRFGPFTAWLDEVARRTALCNDLAIVRWNMDKHYLADLAARDVEIVPTVFVEKGTSLDLNGLFKETGWEDAVLKPCVSGAARHTYRFDRRTIAEVEAIARGLLEDEALMVQPFQENVCATGEDSLMLVEGRFTHSVRKLARAGDFRVQDDHGGTVHDYEATAEQVELAERALAACPSMPTYARVDLVRANDGRWALMELELIEPEMWLRHHAPAADAFAAAIARVLDAPPNA